MITKRDGHGQTECFGCKAKGKYALNWDCFLYTYNGYPYCDGCLKEMLKEFANDLGYNIVKKRVVPKLLPCTCGCKRREHWYQFDSDTGIHYVILKCEKCGKEAKGNNEIDAIDNWNKMIIGEKSHNGGFTNTEFFDNFWLCKNERKEIK